MITLQFGQLDLTKIAALVQQQPGLVKMVNFRDGEHMLLPINVNDMQRTDEHGNTHSITAYCRKDDRNPNLSYFIANLKPSNNDQQLSLSPHVSASLPKRCSLWPQVVETRAATPHLS